MRVSEFGRWFRFLSVVSLMLCGFSINSWAACTAPPTINTTIQTQTIGPMGTRLDQDVPALATVIAGSKVSLEVQATDPSNCSNLYFQWQYWNYASNQWQNFPVGTGIGFFGATVSNSTSSFATATAGFTNYSAPLTITGIPAGFTQAVNPTGLNAPYSTLLISATTTDDSISNSTRSNTVTLTVNSVAWLPDSPGGPASEVVPGPDAAGTNPAYNFGNLPSNSGTYERGTLLPSGHIFALGFDPSSALNTEAINIDVTPGQGDGLPDFWVKSSANLPDPAGNLQRPTVTLLPSGSVLIAGGLKGTADQSASYLWTEGHGATSPYLWTPGTNDSIVATGSLNTARDAATATLLGNGLVLVAGGASNGRVLNTAELYNPAGNGGVGSWTAITAKMTSPRYHHTATLLPNGWVLIVGGNDTTGANTLDSAEIYDPVANKFTATPGTLWAARAYHAATLLADGNVLITGGVDEAGVPVGSTAGSGPSAEIYDLGDGTFFQVAAPMLTARSQHTATLMANGKVLIAGGYLGNATNLNYWLNASEYFDPTADGGDDTVGTFAATSVVLNKRRDRNDSWLVYPSGMVVTAGGTTTADATAGGTTTADAIVPTAEKFGDVASGTPPLPNAAITFSPTTAYFGQTLSAFCGPVRADGTSTLNSDPVGFNAVNFAWVVESGNVINVTYPNWPDTAQIKFTVNATGGAVTISCLATNNYGIPSITPTWANYNNGTGTGPNSNEASLAISGTSNVKVALTSNPGQTTSTLNILGAATLDPNLTSAAALTTGDFTTIPAGNSVTFIATVTGAGTYAYTWQYQAAGAGPWITIPGQTNSTLNLTAVPVTSNNNVYHVIATGTGAGGAGGIFTSNPLNLLVVGPPAVTMTLGPVDMGPSGSCTGPLNPPLAGGTSQTPCAENESAEAAFTAHITPSPVGPRTDIAYQWCELTNGAPTPYVGSSAYWEYYNFGFFSVNPSLANNLCTPNIPAPGAQTVAGPFGAIYPNDIDGPNYTSDTLTYTPAPAAGVSPTFYVVAYDVILGVPGLPVASNQTTETVWAAPTVVITNDTSCPAESLTTAACAADLANPGPEVDPTVDAGKEVTLTATFTSPAWPSSNTDPSYTYIWVYENAIQGWKQFPASNCYPVGGNCSSVRINSADVGSDGLQIQVYVTNGPNTWPGFVANNPVASTNLVKSNTVDLQVIPATTVSIAETATNQANPTTPAPVPATVPEPIQGHQVVFTATIAGTNVGANCTAPTTTAVCQAPNATYTWYQELTPGVQNPPPPVGTGSTPYDTPIVTGPTANNNVSTSGTCDSAYVAAGNTLTINDLCLADGPYPNGTNYYAVAGYTYNNVNNVKPSTNTINLVVNWDQVTSFAPTGSSPTTSYARFDAMSVNLPTIYITAPYDVPGAFWVAGGQNSTQGVLSTSAIYNSNANYNGGTDAITPAAPANDSTTGSFVPVSSTFTAGPHLDGTATLFLSSGNGTPEIAIVGGSDGQDAQNGIEYFVPTWSTGPSAAYTGGAYVGPSTPAYSVPKAPLAGTYTGTGLPPITQQVAAHLPNQSILIAGGQNGDYDTFYNNAWILTPGATPGTGDALAESDATLSVARAASKATTLNDGRVLITGGVDYNGVDNAVDIYDSSKTDENTYVEYPAPGNTIYPLGIYNLSDSHLPSNNTSGDFIAQAICSNHTAPTPCMASARLYHTQTLLNDGRVLITGGINQNGIVQSSMEIWDPTANPTLYGTAGGFYPVGATKSAPTTAHPGTLLTPRMMASAVLLPSGNVLIFGGQDSSGDPLTSAEIVNPNWTWSAGTPSAGVFTNAMTEARSQATATLLQSGEVLATGGVSSSTDIGTLGEIFNALQVQDTPPVPELNSDLVVPPALFEGSTSYATVTETSAPLNNLTDYSWYAAELSPAGPLALTMQEPTVSGIQALTPLSAEAGFTTSATPTAAPNVVAGTYVIDSLVTSQYGLTYLLSQDFSTYGLCGGALPDGNLPGQCTAAPPACTPPTSGGISVVSTTGVTPTLADIANSATGQWDAYYSVTGGTGTFTVNGGWGANPTNADITTNGWVNGGGNTEPYPGTSAVGGDTGIIVNATLITGIKVTVSNTCDTSTFTLTWTGTNTAIHP
jgi:hypothetical protein